MQTFLRGNPIMTAVSCTLTVALLLITGYMLSEPSVVNGQTTRDFTVRQEITGELAVTQPNDVIMDNTIQGISGGTSFGTTSVNVTTNNPAGYTMTIEFADSVAMQQETGTSSIPNYDTGDTNGDYTMTVGAGEAAFAYTASGVAADMDPTFLSDGASDCSTGSVSQAGTCWYNTGSGAATNPETLVNRSSATPGEGATTTLNFQVQVSSGASVETGFYTATSTLTVTEN